MHACMPVTVLYVPCSHRNLLVICSRKTFRRWGRELRSTGAAASETAAAAADRRRSAQWSLALHGRRSRDETET